MIAGFNNSNQVWCKLKMKHTISRWLSKLWSIFDDDISFFAASLSFYSVLSIIPMLWVLFFLLQNLGVFEEYYPLVKDFLMESLVPSQAETVSGYLEQFMGNVDGMGSMGLVYIVIASILFYRNYQYVVNKIFMVPNHSLLHSAGTYLVLALLMPATLGASFYLSDYIQRVVDIGSPVPGGFTLLSYFMVWMLFFVLFKVSPNMTISVSVALRVSFVTSLLWHVAKWGFVQYMFLNQTYSTLYGSFSVLLFLLVWIYLSWLLLLHGLRACYLLHRRMEENSQYHG